MTPPFFWFFSALMLGFALSVIANGSPVASALSLVVSFLGLAALFMSLDAFFIGIIQVVVYAGAVMVLFLFIIMLLDLKAEERREINRVAFVGGVAVAAVFFLELCRVVARLPLARVPLVPLGSQPVNDVRSVGLLLFGGYNLPFQIIGVLLLVGTVGVIILSKRELR